MLVRALLYTLLLLAESFSQKLLPKTALELLNSDTQPRIVVPNPNALTLSSDDILRMGSSFYFNSSAIKVGLQMQAKANGTEVQSYIPKGLTEVDTKSSPFTDLFSGQNPPSSVIGLMKTLSQWWLFALLLLLGLLWNAAHPDKAEVLFKKRK